MHHQSHWAWHRCTRALTWILASLVLGCVSIASATDWPQYRGGEGNGVSPDSIATTWATNSPDFIVWANPSLSNGFSSFAISQGRAFALCSRRLGGSLKEVCAAVDAASGANLWATVIGSAPWDPNSTGNGGDGTAPNNKGDGPRTTPAVQNGRVVASTGLMNLVCMNSTNGSVLWSNNLVTANGASTIDWENGASPRIDGDLVFVNLNTSTSGQTLMAFRLENGQAAWSNRSEGMTHASPILATIEGFRQVIFPTVSGLVSLNTTNGEFLWKYAYPFGTVSTSMGASPVVESNIVFCTASYGRGACAARIQFTDNTWTVTNLFYKTGTRYRSIWMSPVVYQGHIYTLSGDNSTFLNTPLNCFELSTGNQKWFTNQFGMGGLILVGTNLLVLTENGQLVLVQPNPNAYIELARYLAFQFTATAPGKCWNSPAYSNGRIYARSTRGGIALNTAPPAPPPALKILSTELLDSTRLGMVVGTTNGIPISPDRVTRLEVRATNALGQPTRTWPRTTTTMGLSTNGLVRVTNSISPGRPAQYFILSEQP